MRTVACLRCGRRVCSDCARFGVKELDPHSLERARSNKLHPVCGECIEDLIEFRLPGTEAGGRSRGLLVRYVENWAQDLTMQRLKLMRSQMQVEFNRQMRAVKAELRAPAMPLPAVPALPAG